MMVRHAQVVDLQDQQEDRVSDGADGWGESSLQDLPALPADVLATGLQGVHQHDHHHQIITNIDNTNIACW